MLRLKLPTLVSLLFLTVPQLVFSSPCVVFDTSFNLYALGFNGKDWNAGTQDTWSSGSAQDITTSGRPPFDGTGTTCYLAQFFNAIYVINGDAANPSNVHIYDAGAKTWSTQAVTAGSFDFSSFNAILDHDTNVFYAMSKGELFSLDMGSMKAANPSAIPWTDVGKAPYDPSYTPVMALAQNHIHFLDVPDTPAGSARIFVIHFSYFQPEPQAYPLPGGTFPATHGQATSFFQETGVQQEFAFIPDDGSATYVINVETNTTQALPGPSIKDPKASYAAGITSLVQLDSTGAVSFLPYKQGDASTNANAAWAKIAKVAAAAPPGTPGTSTSGTSRPSSTGSGPKPSTSSPPNNNGTQPSGGSRSSTLSTILTLAGILGVFACLL